MSSVFRSFFSDAGNAAVFNVLEFVSEQRKQLLGRIVAFRMNGRRIQRILAAGYAEEACALLERVRAQLGHLFEGGAGGDAVFFAVGDNVPGQSGTDSGDVGQQLGRGGRHLDADQIDALLDDAVQRAGQLVLLEVVLILTHADCLRIDLDQLGKRVLHAAGNGYGAA